MKIVTAAQNAWYAIKSVFTTATIGASLWWNGIMASWGEVSYDALARRAYRNPTAARALRLVSQLMASVPFVVERPDGEQIEGHEMLRLIERPNPRTSRGFLMDQIVAHIYCAGELFFRRVAPTSGPNAGKPTATGGSLTLLNPSRFQDFIREPGTDEITGYRFTDSRGRVQNFTTDEVHHVRIYNPNNEDRGYALLLAAARAMEQQEAADDWNKSLASGGGRVPGYFVPQNLTNGTQLTPEVVAAAQEQSDRATLERRQKNLPQVLSGAFKYEAASMTLKDADFLNANKQNMRHIAAVIGVPATLLGDEKGGSLTDAGVDSEIRATYLFTVLPLLDFVLGELNAWLSPAYGGMRLAYDRDQIEALQEDVNAIFERYNKAVGGPWLTVNEAREANNYDRLGEEYDRVRGSSAPAAERDPQEPAEPSPLRRVDTGGIRAAIKARYSGAAA